MMNRKLVRPNLAELKKEMTGAKAAQVTGAPAREGSVHPRRRVAPPDSTAAEAFYYLKQMNAQTPMVVVLDDGERIEGRIEWYDRNCLKVHRDAGPNVLLYKHCIRYLYKQEDE